MNFVEERKAFFLAERTLTSAISETAFHETQHFFGENISESSSLSLSSRKTPVNVRIILYPVYGAKNRGQRTQKQPRKNGLNSKPISNENRNLRQPKTLSEKCF